MPDPYLLLRNLYLYSHILTPTCTVMICIPYLIPTCPVMISIYTYYRTPTCPVMICIWTHYQTPTCPLIICTYYQTPTCPVMICICTYYQTATRPVIICTYYLSNQYLHLKYLYHNLVTGSLRVIVRWTTCAYGVLLQLFNGTFGRAMEAGGVELLIPKLEKFFYRVGSSVAPSPHVLCSLTVVREVLARDERWAHNAWKWPGGSR